MKHQRRCYPPGSSTLLSDLGAELVWRERCDVGREHVRVGLVARCLDLMVGAHRVGQLEVSYATPESLRTAFPSSLLFAQHHLGWDLRLRDAGDLTDPDAGLWWRAHACAGRSAMSRPSRGVPSSMAAAPQSSTQRREDLAALEQHLNVLLCRALMQFRVPQVAYVHLNRTAPCGTLTRGVGLGRLLYVRAAQRLGAEGLMLRAGDSQSADGERVWRRLEAADDLPTTRIVVPRVRGGRDVVGALDFRGTPRGR